MGNLSVTIPIAAIVFAASFVQSAAGFGYGLVAIPLLTAFFLAPEAALPLSAAEITLLEERTEGWIAGLQMAALSMQGHAAVDMTRLAKRFAGGHQYVFDFLLEEVLRRQPTALQDFLLSTSILERMCAPLCTALQKDATPDVTAVGANQQTLEFLDRANLFVVPLDERRQWYRYHHLFADLLRQRQQQSFGRAQIAGLHRRASDWLAENGLPAEAMHHALAAIDIPRIIKLAGQKASPWLSRGEFVTLLSWLKALPETVVTSQSGTALLSAWAMLLTGQIESVERYLEQAEREAETPDSVAGEVCTLRATVAYFERNMGTAIELYRQALAYLPSDSFLRGCVVQSLGAAYSWRGQVLDATRSFSEASVISRNTGNSQIFLIAQWTLAVLHVEQGQLHHAIEIFEQTLDFVAKQATAEQEELLPFTGRLHVGLAGVLLEQGKTETAGRQLEVGLAMGKQTGEAGTLAAGYLVQARLRHGQGNTESALTAVRRAGQHSGPFYLSTQVAAYHGFLWLAQNNFSAVVEWLKTRDLQLDPLPDSIPYLQEDEYLLLVRLALHVGEQLEDLLGLRQPSLELAAAVLARIKAAAQAGHRTARVLETLVLHALVFRVLQRPEQALVNLEAALKLAEPEEYARIFLDEGPELIGLLRRVAAKNVARSYVGGLLELAGQTLPGVESDLLLDPLSERELEILQLIAVGKSNKELAELLVLTVGTVKWHLNNIYSKLGVRSRTQAVARVRELGLID
jgi:LuxR family maltose regulon positive regulatory protein